MKKFFLVMGAFCVSAAIVSCVDDSESDEIKDLRQVQLDQKKVELDQKKVDLQQKQAALENTYWNNYDKAVAAVKTLQGDLNTAQQNLDGVKSGKLTHEAAKAAAIAYQNTVIARNQKDIKDKETEISVQKSMKGKSYEEIQQATITAENAEELAIKDAQDFWISLTNEGYNENYNGNSVDIDAKYTLKTNILLGDGSYSVKYVNNKLDENKWVKAMNKIFDSNRYYYTYDGETKEAYVYSAKYDLGDGDGLKTYNATDMFNDVILSLEGSNGYQFQTYTKYSFNLKNANNLKRAIKGIVDDMAILDPIPETYYIYKALQNEINAYVEILSSEVEYSVYEALLNKCAENAKKVYDLADAQASATAIADAYRSYSVSDNEATIAALEDAIDGYNKAIEAANKEINEVIENAIVDDATAAKYYEALIAEINSEITFQTAMAEKYRKLLSSSNSQTTPAAETPAAE